MNLRTATEDTLDRRPIKKVTTYAAGTGLQGVALGLFIPVIFSDISLPVRICIGVVCWLIGAVLAISAYSALKRKFKVIENSLNEVEDVSL